MGKANRGLLRANASRGSHRRKLRPRPTETNRRPASDLKQARCSDYQESRSNRVPNRSCHAGMTAYATVIYGPSVATTSPTPRLYARADRPCGSGQANFALPVLRHRFTTTDATPGSVWGTWQATMPPSPTAHKQSTSSPTPSPTHLKTGQSIASQHTHPTHAAALLNH